MIRLLLLLIYLNFPLILFGQRDQVFLEQHFLEQDQELWNQIHTLTASGIWITEEKDRRVDFLMKKPNKIKIIEENNESVFAYNGDVGWMKEKNTENAKVLNAEQTMILSNLYSFGSPLNENSGIKYMGEVSVERVLCHWWIKNDSDIRYEYFVEKEKSLFYKLIIEKKSEKGENEYSISKTISQYRNFQGIKVPSVILVRSSNFEWEFAFDEMLLGEGIRSSIFDFPVNE